MFSFKRHHTFIPGYCVSDTPFAPLGLGKHRYQLLYTYRLSEASVDHMLAPAMRKVSSIIILGLQIFNKKHVLKLTPMGVANALPDGQIVYRNVKKY